ncbi:FG-GAP repeat protein [Leucobacter sp. HY1910]
MPKRIGVLASGLMAGAMLLPLGTSPALAAIPEYNEVAKFSPADGIRAGYSVDFSGDFAAYTRVQGQSVDFAQFVGPTPQDWSTSTVAAPEPDTEFGAAVVFNDDASAAYVSAPKAQTVYEYLRDAAGQWSLARSLTPDVKPSRVTDYGASIGESLSYSAGKLVVGVPNARVDDLRNAGFAFAVDVSAPNETWTPLIAATPLAHSVTGQSVAISGTKAAVSAVQFRDGANKPVGGVYLWDLATGAEPLFTSQPMNDPKTCLNSAGGGPAFGMSLSFFGDYLAVGSPIELNYNADTPEIGCTSEAVAAGDTTQGAVYLFDAALTQTGGKLTPPPFTTGFGYSLDADGEVLLTNGDHGPDYAGEVYVYAMDTIDRVGSGDTNGRQSPAPIQVLTASDAQPGDYFGQQIYGRGLSISGDRALIASPLARAKSGSVYVFQSVGVTTDPTTVVNDVQVTYGQDVTLTGTITKGSFDPATATFMVNGVETSVLDVTGIADGEVLEALVPAATQSAGSYEVELQLKDAAGGSITAVGTPGTLTVAPATTELSIQLETDDEGTILSAVGEVMTQFGTMATGTVTLTHGDKTLGTVELQAGDSSWQLDALQDSLPSPVVATYSGDTNHLTSSAQATHDVSTGVDPEPPVEKETDPLAETGAGNLTAPLTLAGLLALVGVGLLVRRRIKA